MKKKEFIEQLRATAAELKPLTESISPGQRIWNGREYVKSDELKKLDPYALAWWFTLIAIAELVEGQESPLTSKQINYLDGLLFGGMGSFNDMNFDSKNINQRKEALFASFKD